MTRARWHAIIDVADELTRLGAGRASPQAVEALAWWLAERPWGVA